MGLFKNLVKKSIKAAEKETKKEAEEKIKAAQWEAQQKQRIADDIRKHAQFESAQLLKIIHECADLVNTTKNPEVFFPRYNLMLEHLETLAGFECTGIYNNSPELPSTAFLRIEEQFPEETIKFINRSYDEAIAKMENFKTDKGKENTLRRYFEKMEKHTIYMDSESVEYFESLKEKHNLQ